jgi:hypothetical protein
VQNFAARILTNSRKFDHITPLLKEHRWLPVNATLRFRDTVLAHKCLNGYAPEYLTERFITRSQIHERVTRNKDTLNVPFYRTATGPRSFLFRAVKLWNDLRDNVKSGNNLKSVECFKIALKTYLFQQFLNDS